VLRIKNSLAYPFVGSSFSSFFYATGYVITAAFFLAGSETIASPKVGNASLVFTILPLGTNSEAFVLKLDGATGADYAFAGSGNI
jgi:hypothetical protein